MSPELIAHIKDSEKWVPHPYRDPVGLPTIGYGHRIPDMNHPVLTQAQGDALLAQDLAKYESAALKLSPILASHPARLDAITDFCFNCGIRAYQESTLRSMVNMGSWKQAAYQMSLWVHATQPDGTKIVLPGLVKRRKEMAAWLLTGKR